jgi:SAM-dependent methyltransferase
MRCAVCGSSELELHMRVAGAAGPEGLVPTTDRFGTALADIVRCRTCGHMQLRNMPTDAQLREAYGAAESKDYVDEERGQRRTAAIVLDAVERHTDRGRLLDVGSWVGFLLAEASERGWETVGVEPSEYASRYARERLGLDVRTAEILDAELPKHSFEAVVLGDVIEHLPDPGETLDWVADRLAPRGVIAITGPDAGSRLARTMGERWWSVIPTHVHFFTRASMQALLARHGFQILSISTAPKSFTVSYYLGRIRGYSPRIGQALVTAAEKAGVAHRLWAPDFRDRMLVIARRSS